MKSIILAAVFFASMSTAAFSKPIVTYRFATNSTNINVGHLIHTSISDQGIMNISVSRINKGFETQASTRVTESLSQYQFETIKSLAKVLSNAKVSTVVNKYVCLTFVMPIPQGPQALEIATGYNYQNDSFYGDLRLVRSPTACYIRSHTNLVSKADFAKAARLESTIEGIANEVLEAQGFEAN